MVDVDLKRRAWPLLSATTKADRGWGTIDDFLADEGLRNVFAQLEAIEDKLRRGILSVDRADSHRLGQELLTYWGRLGVRTNARVKEAAYKIIFTTSTEVARQARARADEAGEPIFSLASPDIGPKGAVKIAPVVKFGSAMRAACSLSLSPPNRSGSRPPAR